MKTTTIAALTGAALTSAAFLAAPAILPHKVYAAEPVAGEAAVPADASLPVKGAGQYKVMTLAPYVNDATTRRMEDALNRLAADGWRVQTGVGLSVILSR